MSTSRPSMLADPTIHLPEWIRKARSFLSNDDYIECATAVAWQLTDFLRKLEFVPVTNRSCAHPNSYSYSRFDSSISSWNESFDFLSSESPSSEEKKSGEGRGGIPPASLLAVRIEDIASENVIVAVPNSDGNNKVTSPTLADFVASEVNVRPSNSKSDIFEAPQLLQRDVCFALGNILFELFSRGDSLLEVLETDATNSSNDWEDFFANLMVGGEKDDIDTILEDNDTPPPQLKRSSTLTSANESLGASSPTMSTKAKFFLRDLGLPLSICQLVYDLLEAEDGSLYATDTAPISPEDAHFDLTRMVHDPQRFLHDRTSPKLALEKTYLFHQTDTELYGRKETINTLLDTAARVSLHAKSRPNEYYNGGKRPLEVDEFSCEAVFVSGHIGAGKSSLIKQLISYCDSNHWFVLQCDFDRQRTPLSALLQGFDSFFAKFAPVQGDDGYFVRRDPWVQEAFHRISHSIITLVGGEIMCQLFQILPNLSNLFPQASYLAQQKTQKGTVDDVMACIAQSSLSHDSVGSGINRLNHLFHIIFKAICSGGQPVTIIAEDLQWSDAFAMDILVDLLQNAGRPLLLVGSFRDNEVDPDGSLMSQLKNMEESGRNINVGRLVVGELSEVGVNKMLSHKFCLPMRHTLKLARLVHLKTRGNPMYIIEFLRSIIKRNMMTFSVKERRWVWDDIAIDIHMISDGVAELLTRKLQQLPLAVLETLKITSCFGQINTTAIQLLDLGQFEFVPDMKKALELAVEEGIMEKAGHIYAFAHDMLQESTYNLIPPDERKPLHYKIGMSLVQDPKVADNAEVCTLAVDQINLCKEGEDGMLNPVERALFARFNLAAGKHSIAASSYGQARRYFEAGIDLLHSNAWEKQYALTLELYEMSVFVSFMEGKVETVSSRLEEILKNARSFEDALDSRVTRAKLLASQAQYADATGELLDVLKELGEEFPRDAGLRHVAIHVEELQWMLKDVTREKMLELPKIEDTRKLNAMRLMGLLVLLGHYSSPMLVPLLCCRMIRLTFDFGFCEETIPGLLFASHSLFHYSDDDFDLACRISRITEFLLNGNKNEHALRAKLTPFFTVKALAEPVQAFAASTLNGYKSAKIVGDVDNAMMCGMVHCIARLFSIPDLIGLQKYMVNFFQQMARHKRIGVLLSVMSYFNAVADLIGNRDICRIDTRIEMKNNVELYHLALSSQSSYLMHHVITNRMFVHCYFKEHLLVADLAEKFRKLRIGANAGTKRALDFSFAFFEGISALCLARDTKQEKWRQIGEKCVQTMRQHEKYSSWNYENKLSLLEAELHYLDDRHMMAELSYQGAIISAHDHKFFHEEALAHELYGIFLVENKEVLKGLEHLRTAMEEFKKWGALRKVDAVKDFMVLIEQTVNLW